jgi:hypothetical protein
MTITGNPVLDYVSRDVNAAELRARAAARRRRIRRSLAGTFAVLVRTLRLVLLLVLGALMLTTLALTVISGFISRAARRSIVVLNAPRLRHI